MLVIDLRIDPVLLVIRVHGTPASLMWAADRCSLVRGLNLRPLPLLCPQLLLRPDLLPVGGGQAALIRVSAVRYLDLLLQAAPATGTLGDVLGIPIGRTGHRCRAAIDEQSTMGDGKG